MSSGLSEVSIIIGERAAELEKARDVFIAEIRRFVEGILGDLRLLRSDPWVSARIKVDVPREIESGKGSGYLHSHYAMARVNLRFKKGTTFQVIADVNFGISYDEMAGRYAWVITLVPAAKFPRLDDAVWYEWRKSLGENLPPGSTHQEKANTLRFVLRPLGAELTAEIAFNDVKSVLEFLLSTDSALASTVGVDFSPGDEPQSS